MTEEKLQRHQKTVSAAQKNSTAKYGEQ